MPSPSTHPRDPLHGVTLERVINHLVARHGWVAMGERIPVRCFQINPSVKSALKFLRKTDWARQRVEAWYVEEHRELFDKDEELNVQEVADLARTKN